MLFNSNIVDDAEKHIKIIDTVISLRDAYDNLPKCPECGHNELDHSSENQPPGCWNCGCQRVGDKMSNKIAKLKPRVIGPCTGKNCGHCRYLNETIKSLKISPKEGSMPIEDIETLESLKRVLAVHKSGRNL